MCQTMCMLEVNKLKLRKGLLLDYHGNSQIGVSEHGKPQASSKVYFSVQCIGMYRNVCFEVT